MINTKEFWEEVKKQYFEYCENHPFKTTTITICQTSNTFELAWNSYSLCVDIVELADKFLIESGKQEPWPPHEAFLRVCDAKVAIEVKTSPLPVSDIVRQINLYRSYRSFDKWILATTYPLPQSHYDYLANARILHIHLGQRFQDFVKEQANSPCSSSVEV